MKQTRNRKVKQKAMKIIDQLDSETENEIDLFSEINHDNIVRYFDHFHKSIGGENQTFLITEYCQVSQGNISLLFTNQKLKLHNLIERRFEAQNRRG